MCRRLVEYGLAAGMLIMGFGPSSAGAFVAKPSLPEVAIGSAVIPAAMCGVSCSGGGRYIPGPPSVCYERGLNFCGPSGRSFGGSPPPPPPAYGGYGGYGAYGGGGCRTITIERDDGTIRRIRRCD
jgi:hypothetical protein